MMAAAVSVAFSWIETSFVVFGFARLLVFLVAKESTTSSLFTTVTLIKALSVGATSDFPNSHV